MVHDRTLMYCCRVLHWYFFVPELHRKLLHETWRGFLTRWWEEGKRPWGLWDRGSSNLVLFVWLVESRCLNSFVLTPHFLVGLWQSQLSVLDNRLSIQCAWTTYQSTFRLKLKICSEFFNPVEKFPQMYGCFNSWVKPCENSCNCHIYHGSVMGEPLNQLLHC